jgi:hypothetical protein
MKEKSTVLKAIDESESTETAHHDADEEDAEQENLAR